jgi:hypothetical protein
VLTLIRTAAGRFAAALGRLENGVWVCGVAAALCAAVGTVLYLDIPHRLFPDSMSITVTSKGKSARYHLGCKPTSGNLPNAADACQAMRYLFANHEAEHFEAVANRRCGAGPVVKLDGRYHYQDLGYRVDLSCRMTGRQRAFWARIAGLRTTARLGPYPEKPYPITVTRFFFVLSAGSLLMGIGIAFGFVKFNMRRGKRVM